MERRDNHPQSALDETGRVLVEFLEIAITSIVFLKGVYPAGAFERRRYMNMVVHRVRHPQLKDYIHSSMTSLLPFIQKEQVERIAVVFFNMDSTPIERFVFKLTPNQSKVEESDLEFSLRSFLIKLSVSEPLTKSLPKNCRWEIVAYFRSIPQAEGSSKEAEKWIPTHSKQWPQTPVITPIKSITSEPLGVQLYLEHQ